jgi:hypothetical protein
LAPLKNDLHLHGALGRFFAVLHLLKEIHEFAFQAIAVGSAASVRLQRILTGENVTGPKAELLTLDLAAVLQEEGLIDQQELTLIVDDPQKVSS